MKNSTLQTKWNHHSPIRQYLLGIAHRNGEDMTPPLFGMIMRAQSEMSPHFEASVYWGLINKLHSSYMVDEE